MAAPKPLDTTDTTQILVALQAWLNGLQDPNTAQPLLPSAVGLEFTEGDTGLCIKSEGGAIVDEDITGDFTAEFPFMLYWSTFAEPDSAGDIFKPLNDVAAWVKANGTAGMSLGARRTPDMIQAARGPIDAGGKNEKGITTFVSIFVLTYDEEAH